MTAFSESNRPQEPGLATPQTTSTQQATRRDLVDPTIRSVCVYCGSGAGKHPAYMEAAHLLGQRLAENGMSLVYGGGNIGLMGEIARSVLAHGGHVTGIIPDFLKAREIMIEDAQETVVVADMHTRKRMMYERADAFVALPGGIGTLEELIEQLTWAQLGQHAKPILILNTLGFWKPLLVLLAHMRENGFIRPGLEVSYLVAEEVDEIIPSLLASARRKALARRQDHADPEIEAHF